MCISWESGSLLFINSAIEDLSKLSWRPLQTKETTGSSQWALQVSTGLFTSRENKGKPRSTANHLVWYPGPLNFSFLDIILPFEATQVALKQPGRWLSVTFSSLKQTTAKPLLFTEQKLFQKENSLVQVIPVLNKNQLGAIICFWKRGSRKLNLLPGNKGSLFSFTHKRDVNKCGERRKV